MENESHDLSWGLSGPDAETNPDAGEADLLYDGETIASTYEFTEYKNNAESRFFAIGTYSANDRGNMQDRYSSLAEGMQATETWAYDRGIRQHLEHRDREAALEGQRVRAPGNPVGFFQRPTARQLADASRNYHASLGQDQESDLDF